MPLTSDQPQAWVAIIGVASSDVDLATCGHGRAGVLSLARGGVNSMDRVGWILRTW